MVLPHLKCMCIPCLLQMFVKLSPGPLLQGTSMYMLLPLLLDVLLLLVLLVVVLFCNCFQFVVY